MKFLNAKIFLLHILRNQTELWYMQNNIIYKKEKRILPLLDSLSFKCLKAE